MCIIRVIHNKENPFVQLNKKALWDENLPLEAVGLWARCLSRPDNWEFNTTELARSCNLNIQTLRKYFKILLAENYAIKIDLFDEKGRIISPFYAVFEFKLSEDEKNNFIEELKKSLPQTKKPRMVAPPLVNNPLLIKTLKKKEDKEKLKPPKAEPVSKIPKKAKDREKMLNAAMRGISSQQKHNFSTSLQLVEFLKEKYPDKCGSLDVYFKGYLIKDTGKYISERLGNDGEKIVSGLMTLKSLCEIFEKWYDIKIPINME